MNIWYNTTSKLGQEDNPKLLWIPRAENMVSNAYVQSLLGATTRIILEFVGEMPNYQKGLAFNPLSDVIPLFFTWVIQLLFPVSVLLNGILSIQVLEARLFFMYSYV